VTWLQEVSSIFSTPRRPFVSRHYPATMSGTSLTLIRHLSHTLYIVTLNLADLQCERVPRLRVDFSLEPGEHLATRSKRFSHHANNNLGCRPPKGSCVLDTNQGSSTGARNGPDLCRSRGHNHPEDPRRHSTVIIGIRVFRNVEQGDEIRPFKLAFLLNVSGYPQGSTAGVGGSFRVSDCEWSSRFSWPPAHYPQGAISLLWDGHVLPHFD